MIDVVNLQRKVKLDLALIRAFVATLSEKVEESGNSTFTVAFIGDGRMQQLNELFRNKPTTTDVLSFPHEPDEFDSENKSLGDIVISVEQAQKQSAENDLSLDAEIKQLILHGLLHLCGYDHETDNGEMNARELQLREELGI
ncbi:MAG: rRNA maturation RNase YbeY [Pyrinomonadaceae bacterium]